MGVKVGKACGGERVGNKKERNENFSGVPFIFPRRVEISESSSLLSNKKKRDAWLPR